VQDVNNVANNLLWYVRQIQQQNVTCSEYKEKYTNTIVKNLG